LSRVFLTIVAAIQMNLDPIQPLSYATFAYLFLIFFAAHSLSSLFVLRTRQRITPAFTLTTSAIDLAAAAVTLPVSSANNPFFVFFLFVLAEAAFRWGFRETTAMALGGIVLIVLRAYLAARIPVSATLLGDVEFDRAV